MNGMAIKGMAAGMMSRCGLLSLAERLGLEGKAPVLMYHRILADRVGQPCHVQPGMYVTRATFQQQLEFLRERFRVVFLEELLQRAAAGKSLTGLAAITFDDGWQDNYGEAFPLLQRYGVPATIFLATGFIDTDRLFWPEELCRCLERVDLAQLQSPEAPLPLQRLGRLLSRVTGTDRETFLDGCIAMVKVFSPRMRQEVLDHLTMVAGETQLPRQMLNWQEVRTMAASGMVRFGSHTVSHELLDQLDLPSVRQEIASSCSTIEEQLGIPARLFAYPNGNHTGAVRGVLEEQGFRGAVTTRRGLLGRDVPPLDIPRIAMHQDVGNTVPLFRSRMLGVW